jgi:hypothetical protein
MDEEPLTRLKRLVKETKCMLKVNKIQRQIVKFLTMKSPTELPAESILFLFIEKE